jgi:hypothetical protein
MVDVNEDEDGQQKVFNTRYPIVVSHSINAHPAIPRADQMTTKRANEH